MKIPTEDFTDETLAIDDSFGDDVIGVVYMEVDMERHSRYILPIVLHSI